MALTPVDLIIKELCRETGEPEYRSYDLFVGHIRRGFSQLNIVAVQIVKHKVLPLNPYNALDWPIDCIKPVAVGLRRNGVTVMLSIDDAVLPSGKYSSAGTISEAEVEIDRIICGDYVPEYCFSWENGELYGLGPGYNKAGYVTHDKTCRQSFIKGRFYDEDEFKMVYLSDGISEGIEYVPVETEPALRAFALSEYFRVKIPSISQMEFDRYKQEVTLLRKLYNSETAESWAEAFRHNEKSSPK